MCSTFQTYQKSLRRKLWNVLSAGDKWIMRLLFGRVLSRQRWLMDGESGLCDTSPAGAGPGVQGICWGKKIIKKTTAGMLHSFCSLRLSGGDTGSWWMRAMTERRSQTASAPELRSSFTITTIHPPTSHCSPSRTEERCAECCCPEAWTAAETPESFPRSASFLPSNPRDIWALSYFLHMLQFLLHKT